VRNINYLSLDLEYNSDGKNGVEDIIQVGLVVGSPYDGVLYKKAMFSKPSNKKVELHPFITSLTGITQDEYDEQSVSWDVIVDEIKNIHEKYNPFVNPVTWGIGDSYDLVSTVKSEGIKFPFFGRRIIDVKHHFLFLEAANGRSMAGGLKSAMGKHKLKFIGKTHRADDDAFNTLQFYFHLLKRQHLLEETIKNLKAISY
jgi:inhibitor of KinA sporulation pathway (predicted exonuclease)